MARRHGEPVLIEQRVDLVIPAGSASAGGSARRKMPVSTVKPSRSSPRWSGP